MTERYLVFHPGVEEDLEPTLAYYAERDPALPRRLRARLNRRVPLKRFPYIVIYVVSEERVDVLPVVSVRRDPAWIEAAFAGRTGK